MKVDRNRRICGIRIIDIREFLKKMRKQSWFTVFDVSGYFGVPEDRGIGMLEALLKEELIEEKDKDCYCLTVRGNALSMVRFVPRMSKEKADKVFADFMKRVEDVNNDDYYLYRVRRLILFGSYNDPSADDYGDIDIAYELESKIPDSEKSGEACDAIIDAAVSNGRCFQNFLEKRAYPHTVVLNYLRNRSPYISLHPVGDSILKTAGHKQIYP